MLKDYILRTDADFDNAMIFLWHVEVWQIGEVIDFGGLVQRHTPNVVTINGSHYFKEFCEFRVKN